MNGYCKCFRPDAQICTGQWVGYDAGEGWHTMTDVTVTPVNGCPATAVYSTVFVIGVTISVSALLLLAARVECCRRVFKFEPTSPLSEPLTLAAPETLARGSPKWFENRGCLLVLFSLGVVIVGVGSSLLGIFSGFSFFF